MYLCGRPTTRYDTLMSRWYLWVGVGCVTLVVAGGIQYLLHPHPQVQENTIPQLEPALSPPLSPPPPPQTGSSLYIPTKIAEWDSEAGKRMSVSGISFELPAGWHGEVYQSNGWQDAHIYMPSSTPDHIRSLSLNCPPPGKGLEAATRLSQEDRSFSKDGGDYSVSLQKWTAEGNDPWYFIFISGQQSTSSPGIDCLAQGGADEESAAALRKMFETIGLE